MQNLIKKFFNPKGLLIGIVASIASIVIANTIFHNRKLIIKIITEFINLKLVIPIWLIILSLFIFILIIYIIKCTNCNLFFKRYKEDEIDNILWRWDYNRNSNKYEISNITPHCPYCRVELGLDRHDYYECVISECTEFNNLEIFKKDEKEIVKIIKQRIESKFPRPFRKFIQ